MQLSSWLSDLLIFWSGFLRLITRWTLPEGKVGGGRGREGKEGGEKGGKEGGRERGEEGGRGTA